MLLEAINTDSGVVLNFKGVEATSIGVLKADYEKLTVKEGLAHLIIQLGDALGYPKYSEGEPDVQDEVVEVPHDEQDPDVEFPYNPTAFELTRPSG